MFAILRGANGRRHEVDFEDDPVFVDVSMSAATRERLAPATHAPAGSVSTGTRKRLLSPPRATGWERLDKNAPDSRISGDWPKFVSVAQ